MNKLIKKLFISNLLLLFSIFFGLFDVMNYTFAKTIIVDSNGSADFILIQDAIDVASNNDSIFVKSGIYRESINFGVFGKDLTLIGENKESTVIVSNDIDLQGNIVIKCFTIEASDSLSGCGISVHIDYSASNIEIVHNTIENFDNGIKVIDAPIWENEGFQFDCYFEIYGNTIRNNKTGIFLDGAYYNASRTSDYETVIYDAQYNWWGTSDSTEIQETIRNLEWLNRTVDFSNWRESEIVLDVDKLTNGIHNNNIYGNIDWNIYLECDHGAVDKDDIVSSEFFLFQNYPNPFNAITNIEYEIQVKSNVVITIFDINGRFIETIENSKNNPGNYKVKWDASEYSSGIYIIQMQSGDFTQNEKCLLLK